MERFISVLLLVTTFYYHGAVAVCPDGYCRHSNACYLVVGLNVSWIEAKSYCPVLGGTLLSVESEAMDSAVQGALRRSKGMIFPGNFWLDFTDLLNPMDWKRMRDKVGLTYENWHNVAKSVNKTSGNCVMMSEKRDYKWSPTPCTDKNNFICYSHGTSPTSSYHYYSGQRNYNQNVQTKEEPEC